MSQFSATAAAMSGYRLAVKRPLLVLAWAGISFLASILLVIAMFVVMIPLIGGLGALQSLQGENPQMSPGVWSMILPIYGVVLVMSLFWAAIQQTAVNRLILRPEGQGLRLSEGRRRRVPPESPLWSSISFCSWAGAPYGPVFPIWSAWSPTG